jgi:molecular chaperone DnaK (HSP70)
MPTPNSPHRYLVGIDLGTTHTVVAYAAPDSQTIEMFPIPQLVAAGAVAAQDLLPSVRYHPAPEEISSVARTLPWVQDQNNSAILGVYARQLGSQVPSRFVSSAKSWLSHAGVDRQAPILPWGAPAEVEKISPVAASSSYLAHVQSAWNQRFPDHPLAEQNIVLTIPASFDEAARALTLQAAADAGLTQLNLVEEPQAALYDWLHRQGDDLQTQLAHAKRVLVVDVGGGTSDFSMIEVEHNEEPSKRNAPLNLKRVGVGKHLMLGGDNMDLALAHVAEANLNHAGKLSASQFSQLIERCRHAKEQLLADAAPEQVTVTLLGGGSKLIAGSRSTQLHQQQIQDLILNGFFPLVGKEEVPHKRRSALQEFGLPYASDAAITRHLAQFIQAHGLPDTVLLNGGVFRSPALSQRLIATLNQWTEHPVTQLHNLNPDCAVARGAVAYSLARLGQLTRIGGGAARSYYLLLDQKRAVCLLPRGTEAGVELALTQRQFALRLGQPVRFHLVSSTRAEQHSAGTMINIDPSFDVLPPLATVLKNDANNEKQEIPVELVCSLNEVGSLEIHCVALDSENQTRWKLAFQLRGVESNTTEQNEDALQQNHEDKTEELPRQFAQAIELLDSAFGNRGAQLPAKEVKALRGKLERLLGAREQWNMTLLRHLFDALWKRNKQRRRSVEHERLWLNLCGYCLRPGFGYPLDEWRMEQLWAEFDKGVQFKNDKQTASEWWTLWRRVAGGLDSQAQLRMLDDFAFNLQSSVEEQQQAPDHLTNTVTGNAHDMLRLGASLERIPASYKAEIGDWIFQQINAKQAPEDNAIYLWAIARLGTRIPFNSHNSSAHEVIPPEHIASWLKHLFDYDWRRNEAAAFAATHLSRLCGDRARDLPAELRSQVQQALINSNAPSAWQTMLEQVVELDEISKKRIFGESLPSGLKLLG